MTLPYYCKRKKRTTKFRYICDSVEMGRIFTFCIGLRVPLNSAFKKMARGECQIGLARTYGRINSVPYVV